MAKLSEIHQKLEEYGIGIDALSRLNLKDAMELLNYKQAKMKEYASDFIDEKAMDSQIEQAYERSAN